MKHILTDTLATELIKRMKKYEPDMHGKHVGKVLSVTDGVVKVSGLPDCAYLEIVQFQNGVKGVAINLEEESIGVIVLGEYIGISEGHEVKKTGDLLSVPVADSLVGRVINPMGDVIDGGKKIDAKTRYPLEKIAPSVVYRHPVSVPLQTGIKAIDTMIPIGRGQRELIIGDRNTGKTAIAIDTIINQKKENVICIYVAIGQKTSRIAQVVAHLNKFKALPYSIVVAASANDPAAYQYIAPYAGCAIAEYFMDKGRDVLIVYDDLSKHAWAYRQISLILKRPSGREAYPGDVFYLHSRLLERACRLDKKYGGGSITALPIIETLAGDVSAYIPTNVISITDGQLYLESDLFYAGQRPALSVGISVSRVGSTAQNKAMKKVVGRLKLDLVQYRELAAFTQFATDVDDATKKQIERGSRMVELLKQAQFEPMPVEEQIAVVWAGTNGYMDSVPVDRIREFEKEYVDFLKRSYAKTLEMLSKEKVLSEEVESSFIKAVKEFLDIFSTDTANT